jgi:hypothetical protein
MARLAFGQTSPRLIEILYQSRITSGHEFWRGQSRMSDLGYSRPHPDVSGSLETRAFSQWPDAPQHQRFFVPEDSDLSQGRKHFFENFDTFRC